jgi:hypothetical protein
MELGGTGGRRTRGRMQNYAQSGNIFQFSWINFNVRKGKDSSSSVHQQCEVEEEAQN